MLLSLGLLFAALSLGRCIPLQQRETAANRSKLLLVSFDGFRWNYDQDVDTPNLDTMALEGVKAKYMTPAFVTLTSPCHFTLLTGECPLEVPRGWGRAESRLWDRERHKVRRNPDPAAHGALEQARQEMQKW